MEAKLLAEAIDKFSEIIHRHRHWDEMRTPLLEKCRELLQARVCGLFLVRPGQIIDLEDHVGYVPDNGNVLSREELRTEMRYRVGPIGKDGNGEDMYDGITGLVASTGQPFALEGMDDLPPSYRGTPRKLGIGLAQGGHSMYALPLRITDEVVGVLKVEKKHKDGVVIPFDETDKAVLDALGRLFPIGFRFSYFQGLPYKSLFNTTLGWLGRIQRQNLYHNMLEFCAKIFDADVCALYVRTDEGKERRMRAVAFRLENGAPMDLSELEQRGLDRVYRIGKDSDGSYDGLTGKIGTEGLPILVSSYDKLQSIPAIGRKGGAIGKWDEIVWGGNPARNFLCMIGAPLLNEGNPDPIGILKIERANRPGRDVFHEEHLEILKDAADCLAVHVGEILKTGRTLIPGREHEYRVTRDGREQFQYSPLGGVTIRHLMTSICQSDLDYFRHDKDEKKLDDRLPMALGHETVGEILSATPDALDARGRPVMPGQPVFVIPLIPCRSCAICTDTKRSYGENYCPSSRFMASNAPGSLRSSYDYDAGLTIGINPGMPTKLAVFAEPLANVIQVLRELGFGDDTSNLDMCPFDQQDFTFFRVQGQQFTNIFNTIIGQEPHPRTLYVLRNTDALDSKSLRRSVLLQDIMRKGLGLVGLQRDHSLVRDRLVRKPRVLILGSGVSSYLLAVALSEVHGVERDRITVAGHTSSLLDQFKPFASMRVNRTIFPAHDGLIEHLTQGGERPYDVVFQMTGGKSESDPRKDPVTRNMSIAMDAIAPRGTIALFGMSDGLAEIDFGRMISSAIFLKGCYRASLPAYAEALDCIADRPNVQAALEDLIDKDTLIGGRSGDEGVHVIESEQQLTELFRAADARRPRLGRLIVGRLSRSSG